MRIKPTILALAASLSLSGCASGMGGDGFGYGGYSLVRVKETRVGDDSLAVTPPRQWNKVSARLFTDIQDVEDWTQNGPYLDGISFVTDAGYVSSGLVGSYDAPLVRLLAGME